MTQVRAALRQAIGLRSRIPSRRRTGSAQKTAGEAETVYTIGHSTRNTAELLELLRARGVGQVVDIRTIPRSRHNPQFKSEGDIRAIRPRSPRPWAPVTVT